MNTMLFADGSHQHGNLAGAGFFDLWRIDILFVTVLLIAAYLWLTSAQRLKDPNHTVPVSKKVYFIMAFVLFFAVKGTPIDYYGHHYLFSVHMFQMAILYLVFPPLFLLGITDWMVDKVFSGEKSKKILSVMTHPLISILTFNALFSLYHLPVVFDTIMSSHLYHTVFHSVLLIGALQMWWPLMGFKMDKGFINTGLRKIAYIFGNGVLITPVCALIIFATVPIYETYLDAPQLHRFLPTLDDQQLGGIVMKVVQEITYMTAMGIIFFRWARAEREKERQETLSYVRHQQQQDTTGYQQETPLNPVQAVAKGTTNR